MGEDRVNALAQDVHHCPQIIGLGIQRGEEVHRVTEGTKQRPTSDGLAVDAVTGSVARIHRGPVRSTNVQGCHHAQGTRVMELRARLTEVREQRGQEAGILVGGGLKDVVGEDVQSGVGHSDGESVAGVGVGMQEGAA